MRQTNATQHAASCSWCLGFSTAILAGLGMGLPAWGQTSVIWGPTGQRVSIPNTFGQPTFVMPPVSAYPPLLPFPAVNNQPIIYQANPYNQPVLIYPPQNNYNSAPRAYNHYPYGYPTGNNQPIIYQASPHNQPVLIYPPNYRNR